MRRHHLLLLGMIALAPGTALAALAYTITDLGTLGGHNSEGNDINASGQVTGASFTADGFFHAFRWDPVTGMQDLGTLSGALGEISSGSGINDSGQVAGGSGNSAFLWDPVTGMQDLGTLGGAASALTSTTAAK
jgi:probable HAF family extracellular repeat protein